MNAVEREGVQFVGQVHVCIAETLDGSGARARSVKINYGEGEAHSQH